MTDLPAPARAAARTAVRLGAAALMAAAALAPLAAHAEGGLPGSPRAISENSPSTMSSLSQGDAPVAQPAAAAEDPGGAIFSPFATSAATSVPEPRRAGDRSPESGAPDYALPLVVATASMAAIGWLLIKLL